MNTRRARLVMIIPAAILVAVVVAMVVRWRFDGPAGEPGPPVTDIYEMASEGLTRDGSVAMVAESVEHSGHYAYPDGRTRRYWIDVSNALVRIETITPYSSGTATQVSIIREGREHQIQENGEAFDRGLQCQGGVPVLLSLFGSCYSDPRVGDRFDTASRTGLRFDGKDVVAVQTKGKFSGIDSTVHFHDALYIDASTHVPVAFRSDGVDKYALGGHETHFSSTRRFTLEFVSRSTLPAEFFELSQVSYHLEPVPVSPP